MCKKLECLYYHGALIDWQSVQLFWQYQYMMDGDAMLCYAHVWYKLAATDNLRDVLHHGKHAANKGGRSLLSVINLWPN